MTTPMTPDRSRAILIDTAGFETAFVSNLVTAFAELPDFEIVASAPSDLAGALGNPMVRAQLETLVHVAFRDALTRRGSADRPVDPAALELFDAIDRALPEARRAHSETAIEKFVDALVETHDPLARVSKEIDQGNALARMRFIDLIPTVSSDDVAVAAGHSARNRSQTTSRWKSEGRIFSVRWQGQERYPAFQFQDGKPLPVVQDVLAALLPAGLSAWEIAYWFVSTNSWLDDAAPFEVLSQRERVVDAAKQLSHAVVG